MAQNHWRVSRVFHKGSQFIRLQEEAAGTDQNTPRQKPPLRDLSVMCPVQQSGALLDRGGGATVDQLSRI
ncbi:hypothetical protein FYM84_13425 [Pseudomonas sp. CAH-1]|nr:hypothetical protein [Pseudomonas sp. CAH-1]